VKTCRSCFRSDVDDAAELCPHCGKSTTGSAVLRAFRRVAEVVGWVVLTIFVLGLGACVVTLIKK
jgi:reverse gyrase